MRSIDEIKGNTRSFTFIFPLKEEAACLAIPCRLHLERKWKMGNECGFGLKRSENGDWKEVRMGKWRKTWKGKREEIGIETEGEYRKFHLDHQYYYLYWDNIDRRRAILESKSETKVVSSSNIIIEIYI